MSRVRLWKDLKVLVVGLTSTAGTRHSLVKCCPSCIRGRRMSILLCRRSEEHTSELQSLMRISYAVFCLKKKNKNSRTHARKISYHSTHTADEISRENYK